MTKIPAALLAIGLTMGTAGACHAQQPDQTDTYEQECPAFKRAHDGKYYCLDKAESARGLYHFMTWKNGSTIERGYPLYDGKKFVRIDQPIDYDICRDFVASTKLPSNEAEFDQYDRIWCVKAGE